MVVKRKRKLQPRCKKNPATGKPYTRHRYEQTDLRVQTYLQTTGGGLHPYSYSYELTCKRCGFRVHGTY